MAIAASAVILFGGTQDQITTGTPGTVATTAYSVAGDTADWTNDDDAPLGFFVGKFQFDTTMPTIGTIDLYAQMLNIQGTSDAGAPDASYKHVYVGSFPIDYGVAADTDFYTPMPYLAALPWAYTSQVLHFYIHNNDTGQTIGSGWQIWVTPITHGPHPA